MNVSGTVEAVIGQKGSQIWTIAPEATVYEALRMMAEKNVGALLVMRGEELLGLVSERDYTRKVVLRGKTSRELRVEEIMSGALVVVSPKETIEACMRMMTETRVRHLPVHDGKTLRGVVSIGDLVKWIIPQQAATISQLEQYIGGGYSS